MVKTKIEKLKLSTLVSFPNNPQKVPHETMVKITEAMAKDGWYGEMSLVWENEGKKYIISGNHRVECALKAGISEKECIVITDKNYTWKEAKKDVLRFNSLHGDFEEDLLASYLQDYIKDNDESLEYLLEETLIKDDLLIDLKNEKVLIKKEVIKPFSKTHILISFPPHKMADIGGLVNKISEIEGVEIEQGSN